MSQESPRCYDMHITGVFRVGLLWARSAPTILMLMYNHCHCYDFFGLCTMLIIHVVKQCGLLAFDLRVDSVCLLRFGP